jgi:hypothetical protein
VSTGTKEFDLGMSVVSIPVGYGGKENVVDNCDQVAR